MKNDNVVVVGSGFAGIVTTIHLLTFAEYSFNITLIEKKGKWYKGGLAYSENSRHKEFGTEHILNIQAGRISLFRDQPLDFLNWVNEEASKSKWPENWKNVTFLGSSGVPRFCYGQYLTDRLKEAEEKASQKDVTLNEIYGEVTDLEEFAKDVEITYKDQSNKPHFLKANQVILATGHHEFITPGIADKITSNSNYFSTPYLSYTDELLSNLNLYKSIFIIGTGLSAFDFATTLIKKKYKGKIILCSRNGYTHKTYPKNHFHEIITLRRPQFLDENLTVQELCQEVEEEFNKQLQILKDHYPYIDPIVRPERIIKAWEPFVPEIIKTYTAEEIQFLLDKFKSLITTMRSSVVSEVGDLITEKLDDHSNKMEIWSGEIIDMQNATGNDINVKIKNKNDQIEDVNVGAVVCAMGVQSNYNEIQQELWRNLIDKRGLSCPHPKTMLGIKVGRCGELIGKTGNMSLKIIAVGAMRQGDEIERRGRLGAFVFSIGTIRNQALFAALTIIKRIELPNHNRLNQLKINELEKLTEQKLEDSKIKKRFEHLSKAMESVLQIPTPEEYPKIRKKLLVIQNKICNDLTTHEKNKNIIKHLIWHNARLLAAGRLSKISSLSGDYLRVKLYGNESDQVKLMREILDAKDLIKKAVRILEAQSGSILKIDSLAKSLYPFAQYRRQDTFTPTQYGEAITGNLLETYLENSNKFKGETSLQVCIENGRILGVIIPNYNILPEKFKKPKYRSKRINRKFPSVLVMLLIEEQQPLGVLYLESDVPFKKENINDLKIYAPKANSILSKADFKNITINNRDKRNFDYSHSDLAGDDFRNFDLRNTNFSHANLSFTDLSSADLTGSKCIKSNFTDANLSNSKLVNANFYNAILKEADLRGASLIEADLQDADLSNSNMIGASVESSNFENAILSGVQLINISVKGAIFKGASFNGAHLQRLIDVSKANWENVDLTGAVIDDITLAQLPKQLISKYKQFQFKSYKDQLSIIRTITFAEEGYINAAIGVLHYLKFLLKDYKLIEKNDFRLIENEDSLSITIVVRIKEKNKENIEELLKKYGEFVSGKNIELENSLIKNWQQNQIWEHIKLAKNILSKYNIRHNASTKIKTLRTRIYQGVSISPKNYITNQSIGEDIDSLIEQNKALKKQIDALEQEEVNFENDRILYTGKISSWLASLIRKSIMFLLAVLFLGYVIALLSGIYSIEYGLAIIFTLLTILGFYGITYKKFDKIIGKWIEKTIKKFLEK